MSHQQQLGSGTPENYDALSISSGGFGGHNALESAAKIGLITMNMLGMPNGVAYKGPDGKLPVRMFPAGSSVNSVTVNGPAELTPGAAGVYVITNYDILTTYSVTALSGSLTYSGSEITYTAPLSGNVGSFSVNGRVIDIPINTSNYVNQPTVTAPANNSTDLGPNMVVTTTAFSVTGQSDTHQMSDMEISTSVGFEVGTVIISSWADAVNKTQWNVSNIPAGSTFTDPNAVLYIRARHKGTNDSWSQWSPTVSFKPKLVYLPDAPVIVSPSSGTSGVGTSLTASVNSYSFPNSNDGLRNVVFELWENAAGTGTLVTQTLTETAYSHQFTGLSQNKTYVIRAYFVSQSGLASPFSQTVSFSTSQSFAPVTPAMVSPVSGSNYTDIYATLASSAFSYPGGSTLKYVVFQVWDGAVDTGTLVGETGINTALSFDISNLEMNKTYNARVKHVANDNTESAWSAPVTYTTSMASVVPTIFIQNNTIPIGPWVGVTETSNNTSTFIVGITFQTDTIQSSFALSVLHERTSGNGHNVSVSDYYDPNGVYVARARYVFTDGSSSAWSNVVNFGTLQYYIANPVIYSPANNATGIGSSTSVSLSDYTPVNGSIGTFAEAVIEFIAGTTISDASVGRTIQHNPDLGYVVLNGLLPNTTYTMRVRYVSSNGVSSPWILSSFSTKASFLPVTEIWRNSDFGRIAVSGDGKRFATVSQYTGSFVGNGSMISPFMQINVYRIEPNNSVVYEGYLLNTSMITWGISPSYTADASGTSTGNYIGFNYDGTRMFVTSPDGELSNFDSGFASVWDRDSSGSWSLSYNVFDHVDWGFAWNAVMSGDGLHLFIDATYRSNNVPTIRCYSADPTSYSLETIIYLPVDWASGSNFEAIGVSHDGNTLAVIGHTTDPYSLTKPIAIYRRVDKTNPWLNEVTFNLDVSASSEVIGLDYQSKIHVNDTGTMINIVKGRSAYCLRKPPSELGTWTGGGVWINNGGTISPDNIAPTNYSYVCTDGNADGTLTVRPVDKLIGAVEAPTILQWFQNTPDSLTAPSVLDTNNVYPDSGSSDIRIGDIAVSDTISTSAQTGTLILCGEARDYPYSGPTTRVYR